jgi:polyisoprenoid-binding protein YceI
MMACTTPSAAPAAAPATAARPSANGETTAPTSAVIAQSPAQSAAPGDSPAASGLRLTLTPGGSEARYRAREQFVGAPALSEAVGTTSAVEGQVVLDATGRVVPDASRIIVDLSTLRSDQQTRDRYLRDITLQTGQHPTAQFVPTEVRGLPNPPPSAGEVSFQLAGDLTLRGTTRPVVWDVRARVAGADVTGQATTRFTLADFGIPKPTVSRVLSIEDTIIFELDFRATTG